MNQFRRVLFTAVALSIVAVIPANAAITAITATAAPTGTLQEEIAGDWAGAIDLGTASMRIVFHITHGEDGNLAATMDSPDQGAFGIGIDSTTFADGTLKMTITAIGGGYEGTLAEDGTVQGTWSQSGQSLPLNLTRQE